VGPAPVVLADNSSVLAYRYLFAQLVSREFRRKYKGSTLGVLWYLVNPLVLLGAYTLMFGHVLSLPRFPDYPIFLMAGIVVWTFFQQSLLSSAESLIDQGALLRKARFPRGTIPASTVAVQLITFVAILVLLAPVAIVLRGSFEPALLLLPVVVVLLFCFVLGCALIVAVSHAYFRDVAPILTAALLPWFFLTPIFFEPSKIAFVQRNPFVGTLLDWVNPVAPFVEAVRSILYYGRAPWGQLLYAALAAAAALVLGGAVFRRMQADLAVVV
jgi:ABC-type polysaccharide/polyol phosphate export permease